MGAGMGVGMGSRAWRGKTGRVDRGRTSTYRARHGGALLTLPRARHARAARRQPATCGQRQSELQRLFERPMTLTAIDW